MGAFALICLAVAAAIPIVNPDIFQHLNVGRHIIREGAVPRTEWISWTQQGSPWIDYEWGAQLAYRFFFGVGGIAGLFALKALLFLGAAVVFQAVLSLYKPADSIRALATALWACAMLPMADIKPEQFSVFAFLVLLLLLERHRLRIRVLRFWEALLLFAAWACFHPVFVFGLLLIAIYWMAGEKKLALVLVAAIIGTLLQPYGPSLYGPVFVHARDVLTLRQIVSEWASPGLRNLWYWPFFGLQSFGVLVFARALLSSHSISRLNWLVWCAFAVAGLCSSRFAVYLACAGLPVLVQLTAGLPKRIWSFAEVACGLALAAYSMANGISMGTFQSLSRTDYLPVGAASFLAANASTLNNAKLYNPAVWGGYLGWQLGPKGFHIFSDGRYLPFGEIWREEQDAWSSPQDWQAFLDRHGVDLAIVEPRVARIMGGKRWTILYADAMAEVLAKPSGMR